MRRVRDAERIVANRDCHDEMRDEGHDPESRDREADGRHHDRHRGHHPGPDQQAPPNRQGPRPLAKEQRVGHPKAKAVQQVPAIAGEQHCPPGDAGLRDGLGDRFGQQCSGCLQGNPRKAPWLLVDWHCAVAQGQVHGLQQRLPHRWRQGRQYRHLGGD